MNSTVQSWSELEGKVLNGQYRLDRCLSTEDSAAVFSTEMGEEKTAAVIRITVLTENGQQQREVSRLQRVQSLAHPNLIQLYGFGVGEVEGLPVTYAVLEASDDNLATVLVDRPLEHAELMELLNALVDPLEYLHGEGLVHTGLMPANIFAVGEKIKIASDCVQEPRSPRAKAPKSPYTPPEFDTAGWTPAGDIWMLGVAMFFSLTQRYPVSASTIQNANLPLKIAALLSRCLQLDPEQRPTSPQIVAWSKRGVPFPSPRANSTPVQPIRETPQQTPPASNGHGIAAAQAARAAAAGAAQAAAAPVSQVSPAPAEAPVPTSLPKVVEETPAPPPAKAKPDFVLNDLDDDDPQPTPRIREELPRVDRFTALERYEGEAKRPAWIYAVLAIFVIVGIIWVLRASHRSPAQPGPAKTAVASSGASTPVPAEQGARPKTSPAPVAKAPKPGSNIKPAVSAATPKTTLANAGTNLDRQQVWRVIVFTYNHRDNAEQKVRSINQKHSGLRAEVFIPNAANAPYLVALGGWMNHDGAIRLRRAAASKGMPHDAYVQNFRR